MGGADREEYVEELRSLTGHDWHPGDGVLDRTSWPDYWVRTWGARGLLHVWDDSATSAVVAGLADEHWRPAEMCLKVAARHDVAGTGDAASLLLAHELPRVRAQALRALAVAGDTEHVELVRDRLEDPDEAVRVQAERALTRMGVPDGRRTGPVVPGVLGPRSGPHRRRWLPCRAVVLELEAESVHRRLASPHRRPGRGPARRRPRRLRRLRRGGRPGLVRVAQPTQAQRRRRAEGGLVAAARSAHEHPPRSRTDEVAFPDETTVTTIVKARRRRGREGRHRSGTCLYVGNGTSPEGPSTARYENGVSAGHPERRRGRGAVPRDARRRDVRLARRRGDHADGGCSARPSRATRSASAATDSRRGRRRPGGEARSSPTPTDDKAQDATSPTPSRRWSRTNGKPTGLDFDGRRRARRSTPPSSACVLKEGSGAAVKASDTVTVNYLGATYERGRPLRRELLRRHR